MSTVPSSAYSVSEKPAPTSTHNGHQESKTPESTILATGDQISRKPNPGLTKIGVIAGIAVASVIICIIIIAVIIVKCCVLPIKEKSYSETVQKGQHVTVTVTENDVTLTESNGLMSNAHRADHVEYADINLPSSVPKDDDTGGQVKASVDASKSLVYADLALTNNTSINVKVDAKEQMHSPEMTDDDIAQLYAKPMKKKK